MKDILWKYAQIYIYSKGNTGDLENKKKKSETCYSTLDSFVDEKIFRIRIYISKETNTSRSYSPSLVILWYRKILSYLVVDHVPISSLKIKLQNFNFFFIIVVVVTTVTIVRNKSPLTYLNTCTQQLVDRYYRFKPRSLCYENRIRTIHDHGSANEK